MPKRIGRVEPHQADRDFEKRVEQALKHFRASVRLEEQKPLREECCPCWMHIPIG